MIATRTNGGPPAESPRCDGDELAQRVAGWHTPDRPYCSNGLISPAHSFIDQSLHSRLGAEPTNGDGFRIGGARRFPLSIPFDDHASGNDTAPSHYYDELLRWEKPVHFTGDCADPNFTAAWGRTWAERQGASFDPLTDANGRIIDAISRVLNEEREPMHARAVHARVEALLGESVRWASVKATLAGNLAGPQPRFVRVARGRYRVASPRTQG